jgi:hypothetical protein
MRLDSTVDFDREAAWNLLRKPMTRQSIKKRQTIPRLEEDFECGFFQDAASMIERSPRSQRLSTGLVRRGL